MKKALNVFLMAALIAGSVLAMGCRTARGFGEDVEAAGEKVQDVAD